MVTSRRAASDRPTPVLPVVCVSSLLTDVPVNGLGGVGGEGYVAKYMSLRTSPAGLELRTCDHRIPGSLGEPQPSLQRSGTSPDSVGGP